MKVSPSSEPWVVTSKETIVMSSTNNGIIGECPLGAERSPDAMGPVETKEKFSALWGTL